MTSRSEKDRISERGGSIFGIASMFGIFFLAYIYIYMYKSLPGFIYLYSWRTRRATSIGFLVLACGPHDIDWPWQWLACGPPMCAAYGSDWPAGRLVVAGLRAALWWQACGPLRSGCQLLRSSWPAGRFVVARSLVESSWPVGHPILVSYIYILYLRDF